MPNVQPENPPPSPASPARPARARRTLTRVRVMEHVARMTITIGGLGVIIAVLGIMVFLGATVLPLFERGRASVLVERSVPSMPPAFGMLDEYAGLVTTVSEDAVARTVYIPTGEVVFQMRVIAEGARPTAWNFSRQQGIFVFGFADGRIQLGQIAYTAEFIPESERTPEMQAMLLGDRLRHQDGYVERAALDQFRFVRPTIEMRSPATLETGSGPVLLVDYRQAASSEVVLAVREQGAALNRVRIVRPLGGGAPRTTLSPTSFEAVLPQQKSGVMADRAYVTGDGAHILLLWKDGLIQRYTAAQDAGGDGTFLAADWIQATLPGEKVTASGMLLGSKTLMLGTDRGRTLGVFVARDDGVAPVSPLDRRRIVVAHEMTVSAGPVTALAISQRDRSFIAGGADGASAFRNMTSGKHIATFQSLGTEPVAFADISPKLDAVFLLDRAGKYRLWSIDPGHAEASTRSLFGAVWYEGDSGPSYTYQSSSGEDSAEPKLSLVPLLWGTLKATIYAMVFAVPLALLAAIYTSEMLHPDVRNRVKPVVETMASLPSVVLGFIAALVVAPLARDWLPSILIAFFVVPFTVLFAAYLWQIQPVRRTSRLRTGQHFAMVVCVTLVGLAASLGLGSVVERVLFRPSTGDILALAGSTEPVAKEAIPSWAQGKVALSSEEQRRLRADGLYFRNGAVVRPVGTLSDPAVAARVRAFDLDRADIRLWLDGVIGGPWPGWFLLLLGPSALIAVFVKDRVLSPHLDRFEALRFGRTAAIAELCKFLGTCIATMALSAAIGWVVSATGLDPRDSIMGPFNQRNSLVVGIIMGFAIIPIIFTVSEDALSAVSPALRSASLGAGATRWQTAIRVVLPVAASGIFSACMIGLGRAAGETMIVLMATGNTPSMDTSMFSGFRTLAANIAVELPEAPRESTHYRVLFLCGLALFAMTFAVNTIAELVRQRFRKRTAGL